MILAQLFGLGTMFIYLSLTILGIYTMILLIKALKIYIKNNS
ncbi:hypothetical protein SAMN00017405_1117 [Desulfonispora thiosulfatigenes DSM 11270]|uniref:Uncharacterized protein n=1 Tax=Desulfonispora thiosulfatigenes DSM 11270 TaxID=656914 RepID=A0A1W1UYD5_DESTI|nr:hypothetical protein [Desulfonispora thiosulfatigenes]SMB86103.1 hypothetical protein SAMN00017405_1117 [Desulfonispora thiosulfatigenes DSM 11270]